MCENLHYESVYFKELHNQQEYYWPTIYKTGAAVVSTITSFNNTHLKSSLGVFFLDPLDKSVRDPCWNRIMRFREYKKALAS